MELSDNPHAVGTSEHSDWVKFTFIPWQYRDRPEGDGARVGAESQGRRLLLGDTHNLDGTAKEPTFTRLQIGALDLTDQIKSLTWSADQATNNYKFLYEEFTGFSAEWYMIDDLPEVSGASYTRGFSRAERRAKPIKAKQQRNQMVPKRTRECPRHGGPADRCRICQR